MTWSLASTLADYYRAKSWVETPAQILSTKLDVRRGDESTSYVVLAEYRYDFDGATYESDRVGIATEHERDRYDRQMHAKLKELRKRGKPTVCYVDPNNPENALLDRGLRPTVVLFHLPFVICFNLVGFGIVGSAFYIARQERIRAKVLDLHPDEPWRVRPDWTAGEVRSSNGTALLGTLAMALFWNGLAMPAFAIVCLDDRSEWWLRLLVGIFPLIGIGLIGSLVYQLARRVRFGASTFRMAHTPGLVGGELGGVVMVSPELQPDGGFRVRLSCLKTVQKKRRNGDDSKAQVTKWQDERIIDRSLHDPSGRRGVPVRFTIPSDAKPTDFEADEPISWRLTIDAETPGPNYKAEFEVPVFLTEDSRDGVEVSATPLTAFERDESLAEALAREGIRVTDSNGELRIVCPPLRQPLTALGCAVVGLTLAGASVGMFLYMQEWVKWIFVPISGLFGTMLTVVAIDLLLGSSDLRIANDRWRLRSGWYGLRFIERAFLPGDVRNIGVKQAMSSQSGNGPKKKWNNITARLAGGRKLTLARSLLNRRAEQMMIDELRRRAETGRGDPGADA